MPTCRSVYSYKSITYLKLTHDLLVENNDESKQQT